MKRDRLFSLLWAVALSLCIALSGVCCLITGFSLSADMTGIVLFCIAFAIVSALVNMMEKGTPFSPSHSMNSRSMASGSWRMSMSTNRLVISSRCRI